MNKEQIIIDGVDVSGCEYSSTTPSSVLCYMKGNKCNDNPNCYFKQLARKTQECEELKEYKAVVDELTGKQIILTNKDKMPELYENAKDLKLNRYRKALEEIERICLQDRDISDMCLISTRLENPRCKYDIQDEILDIISKVKEGK